MTSHRSIQSVLLTDIVQSTVRAAELGDREWSDLLAQHHARVRREIRRFDGREVKALGDGFIAVFARPAEAIRCAWAIRESVRDLDLNITAGVHTGAVENDGEDIGGIAVHIAARVQSRAEPGEILVSDVTRMLEIGSGFQFEDRGEHELKGVPDAWRLFALRAVPAKTERQPSGRWPAGGDPIRSIAVLPFQNLSGTEEAEPFAAGLHDDLLTALSKISALTVISRTSVMSYRGTAKPAPEIARELGVGTLLEGGVQRAGERIRLNVKLVDARRDVQQWAESYDRELSTENIFEIQSELAERIAGSLRAKLTPQEKRRVRRKPTGNLEAYRFSVQGRTHLDQRTEDGMRRALECFKRAIEVDSSYALAWVGLADALVLLEDYGYAPPGSGPRPRQAIRRALQLNPSLAEAHASLGLVEYQERKGPAAVGELKRAIDLQPSYAEAYNWLAWVGQLLGRSQEALESARRAVELDPLAPEPRSNLSLSHLATGENREALREAQRAREIQPSYATGPFYEGVALYHLGRLAAARSVLQDLSVPWAGSGPLATLALVHVASGDQVRARELLAGLEDLACRFEVGLLRAALGETDAAFDDFAKLDHWDYWPTLSIRFLYPQALASIREDPRYERLLGEVDRSWGFESADDGLAS